MKKFIALFLAIILVISLMGCNNVAPDVSETDGVATDATYEVNETEANDATNETTGDTSPTDETTGTSEATEPSETVVVDNEHEHNYTTTVTSATCTEDGYTFYECDCGDSYTSDYVVATGHVWGDWVTIKAATEEAIGKAERYCSVCGETEEKDLAKEIAGHTHSYTSQVTTEPTCSTVGIRTYTCQCGDTYTEEIEMVSHTYTSVVTKPTCTENGYTTYTCSACKNSYKDDYVAATGHSYKDVVTAATCTAGGYTTHTCTACKYSYTDSETSATGHNWGAWTTTKEPTTTSTGTATRKCSACGKTETKTLDKLTENHTHSYTSEVTKAATCTTDGVRIYLCSCGDTYTETIAKTGHSYKTTTTAATCTEQGYTTHTCGKCGDSYKDAYTSAKGHSYTSKVTTAATCTTNGVKTYTCSTCNHSYTESIDKLGHNYTSTVTAATCTTDGYTTHTCTRCGNSYKDNATSATGHSWNSGVVTTAATCNSTGVKTYTCTKCGATKTETIAKTSHSYTSKVTTAATCNKEGVRTYTCSNCGHSYTESIAKTSHNYEVTSNTATCGSSGVKTETCTICGDIKTSVVNAAGSHNYTITMTLSDAVMAEYKKGYTDYITYINCEDWNVNVCGCGAINIDSMEWKYTDYKTADIMLVYVNQLRESVGASALQLDETLIELAKIQAKEYANGGVTTYSYGAGNYIDGGYSISDHFERFSNDNGAYSIMVNSKLKYFGYGVYHPTYGRATLYGVQLFWTKSQYNTWYGY